MFGLKRRRRQRARRRPFPREWLTIVKQNVAYYGLLTREEQAELRGHMQVFLDEKRFEGCAGLEITDEIRVTLAAQACLLLLHRPTNYFPKMETLLVYPQGYFAEGKQLLPGGAVLEGIQARLGESWYRGPVVLAWDEVQYSGLRIDDGQNVVLHEFAHQLDSESGANEGVPLLPCRAMYATWARVFGTEYAQLVEAVKLGRATAIRAYGAVSPAEFFAVATEEFFERPTQLKRIHPQLYEQLMTFYRQDPAERLVLSQRGPQ